MRIAFSDMWRNFDRDDNFITHALRRVTEVELVEPSDDADVLVYSCFGDQRHYRYRRPIRIYFTGENDVPRLSECDYAISFNPLQLDGRHLEFPLYCVYDEDGTIQFSRLRDREWRRQMLEGLGDLSKRDFCSVVISNNADADPFRQQFVEALDSRKPLASGGRWRNNVGGPVADKIAFLGRHKFNIAFENSLTPYYTTEKLINAYYAGTVPIYWGNPRVAEHFDPSTMINVADFPTVDDAIDHIMRVDADDELYMSYFAADPLAHNPFVSWEERLDTFLRQCLERGKCLSLTGRAARLYAASDLSARMLSMPLMSKLTRRWRDAKAKK